MLFNHQKQAVDFITNRGGVGALFHDIGCGKTLTCIEIFKKLKEKEDLKLFVVCPLSLIEGAWIKDIQKFSNFTFQNLHKKKSKEDVEDVDDVDIYIINFESVYKINLDFPNIMCVIDESSKIKTHNTKITKHLLKLRSRFKYRVIASGTPAPNSELEYWPQMTFLQDGIFHRSFHAFKNTYFHLQRGNQVMQGQILSREMARDIFSKGWKYDITDKNREELLKRIIPHCHWAKKELCLDLPEQIDQERIVYMEGDQLKAYLEMKRNFVASISGRAIVAPMAVTQIMKLRQITSGFAIDDKGNVRDIGKNPKLNELKNVLEEAGEEQAIIWCQFHHEIESLLEEIPNSIALYGETKDKSEPINKFLSGEAKYLIAHPASAGHGLTFVNCRLQIFYSLDYSWERYEQARGRTHRVGQKQTCLYVHIMAKNSIDEIILKVLRKKGSSAEFIEEFLR